MYKNKRILVIVPARGGSKGLLRKNIRPLAGKPLVAWSIEQARASARVDRVVVSTEDEEIAAVARRFGADVPFLRPAELAQDASPVSSAILHVVETLRAAADVYDIVMLLECTSPVRYPRQIDDAIAALVDHPTAGSVVGVVKLTHEHPAWTFRVADGRLVSYAGDGGPTQATSQRQALPDAFLPYSLYASWVSTFERFRLFYQPDTIPFELRREQMVEIDDEVDLFIAESIMNRYVVSAW